MTASPAVQSATLDKVSARAFVDEYVMPAARSFDDSQAISREFLDLVAKAGVFGAVIPRTFGGLGLDMVTLGEVHEEFGRGCSSLRSLLTVHSMVSWAIATRGTDSQRSTWLESLASGAALASFCLSEAAAGSNTRGIATTARQVGGDWVISGGKTWITGGQIADLYLVFARAGHDIMGFLVPRDAGVEVVPITDVLGTRASMLAELVLDDVRVPADARLGPRGFAPGFVMTAALDIGRYSVACGCVGIVQACLEASAAYAQRRRVGETLLSDFQLTQQKVAEMVTAAAAGRALCRHAGQLKDVGDHATVMATWIAKYFASRAAARAASDAVQLHGAHGCTGDYPVARYYRDAKVMEIIEGSSELQQVTIAEAAYQGRPR